MSRDMQLGDSPEYRGARADAIKELAAEFDLVAHIHRQMLWSARTFGPGPRTKGITDHIKKELDVEIAADPTDLAEWIDIVILGLDGAWRAGHSPAEIVYMLEAKQLTNEQRRWPDWRTADTDLAIEHIR